MESAPVTSSIRRVAVLAALFAWAGSVLADVTPTLTPDKLTLRATESGEFRGQIALVLKGVTTETPEPKLGVSDWNIGSAQTVTVEATSGPGGLADERQWRLDLTLEHRPEIKTDSRFLWIEYGKQLRTALPYSVLPTRTELDWSVSNPINDWVLHRNQTLGFSVTTNTLPAEDLKISLSTLQRTDKQQHLDVSDFKLCKDTACNDVAISLAANKTHPVFLKTADVFAATGQFEGALHISAQGAKAAHQLPITIYASSWGWRLAGGGLIALGIALAWFVSVFAKGRNARLAGLLPASVLREQIDALEKYLKTANDVTSTDFPTILDALEQLTQALSDDAITTAGYVPRPYPNPFRAMAPKEQQYEAYLKDHADRLGRLALIVVNGINYLAGHWPRIDGREEPAKPLLSALDGAATLSELTKVNALVDDSVEAFRQILIDARPQRSAQFPAPEALPESATSLNKQTIEVRLATLSGVVWTIWALVTAGVGWVVLIQSNPGFGTVTDLIEAFFWGLGVQVAGQQLQQLTPASVRSAFQIAVPSSK